MALALNPRRTKHLDVAGPLSLQTASLDRQYFDRPRASACFASSAAQKRSFNGHFAVIFEKPGVAIQAQDFRFKSPIYIAPAGGQQPEHGCRCGRRAAPELADCWRALCVVRNSLRGPNGVSEWVWQARASRETIGGGQPFSLSSKSCRGSAR
jgi:hypothetical protein